MRPEYPVGNRLSDFPYVNVRVHCRRCERFGVYELVRLAACYGPEIDLGELVKQLSADCHHRRETHPYRQVCQACLLDWPPLRPPDEPMSTFAVVTGGKKAV